MKTTYIYLLVLFTGPFLSRGETLDGLASEMDAAKSELPGLNSTMSQTTEANISLKKEYDLYVEDQKEKKSALAAASAEVERTVKQPAEQQLANEVATY